MSDRYDPELGQALFGNATSEYSCPGYIRAGLMMLAAELTRVQMNITQDFHYRPPTENVGDVFECPVFALRSYYWGSCLNECDEETGRCAPGCPTRRANFESEGFEVRWYKYMGRGMSMNRRIDAKEYFEIIDRCMDYLAELDLANDPLPR